MRLSTQKQNEWKPNAVDCDAIFDISMIVHNVLWRNPVETQKRVHVFNILTLMSACVMFPRLTNWELERKNNTIKFRKQKKNILDWRLNGCQIIFARTKFKWKPVGDDFSTRTLWREINPNWIFDSREKTKRGSNNWNHKYTHQNNVNTILIGRLWCDIWYVNECSWRALTKSGLDKEASSRFQPFDIDDCLRTVSEIDELGTRTKNNITIKFRKQKIHVLMIIINKHEYISLLSMFRTHDNVFRMHVPFVCVLRW